MYSNNRNSNNNNNINNYETLENAFDSTVAALAVDMPILMHGAGDVGPDSVDPLTVQLLSTLTAQYISRLVDAAIDSREMLLDHQHLYLPQQHHHDDNNKKRKGLDNHGKTLIRKPEPPLPPPIFQRSRNPQIPMPPDDDDQNHVNNHIGKALSPSTKTGGGSSSKKKLSSSQPLNHNNNIGTSNSNTNKMVSKKRKRFANIEYWDDPLPEPIIRSHQTNEGIGLDNNNNNSNNEGGNEITFDEKDDDNINRTDNDVSNEPVVHIDEWVGVAGVDLLENRCRSAYVRGAAAITSQSFMFPICHDVYMYGRIREIQSAKRTTYNNLLTDQVLLDIIRTEGRNYYKKQNKKKNNQSKNNKNGNNKNKNKKNEGNSDGEDEDGEDDNNEDDDDEDDMEGGVNQDDDEDGQPMWPGLDMILPVHRW